MPATRHPEVDRITAQLRHPVIDADGHTVEVTPVLFDFVRDAGGASGVARFEAHMRALATRPNDGPGFWRVQPRHWVMPANTIDRATGALPRLYYARMDEIGLDLSLVYPTLGLTFSTIDDPEMRVLACRAVNLYVAELHRGLEDRLLPVATIPMHTPEEAIAELDFAVRELGLRAAVLPSFVKRPITAAGLDGPYRVDAFGVDGEFDYDSVWARLVELGVVPGVHTPTWGMPFRESATNFVYTHVGQFSSGCEVFCRSMILGGVFHRFPGLRVAALEGGVGWAATLYAMLLAHWEKRNGEVISQYDPARLDARELASFVDRYGHDRVTASAEQVLADLTRGMGAVPAQLDDFGACPFADAEALRDAFTDHVYVGCEADDPMTALAFDTAKNPQHAHFRVLLGSDIGHWDVPDSSIVLREAFELVDDGLMGEADFEEFTFSNAVRLYGGANPDFFAGTRVEQAARERLASLDAKPRALGSRVNDASVRRSGREGT